MKTFQFPTEKEIKNQAQYVLRKKDKDITELKRNGLQWARAWWENKMDYETTWLGIPIIQNPYDIVLMQELIFRLKPDVIIETGIAHGGSLIYYSSLLELLGKGKIIGIDIDIRKHNRKLLEKHPMINRITMIEGSSVDEKIVAKIKRLIKSTDTVLVLLDSDHRKDHVYKELELYKTLVTKNSYIVVFDTIMTYLTGLKTKTSTYREEDYENNNAMDAVKLFLKKNSNFQIDTDFNKYIVSSCPDGFLKKIK